MSYYRHTCLALLVFSSATQAVPAYQLRYAFSAGEALLYEASTRAEVVIRTAAEPTPQTATVEVSSLVGYRVRSCDSETGTARLAVYLKRLHLLTPGQTEPHALRLEAAANALSVQADEAHQVSVMLWGKTPLPDWLTGWFGGYDPRGLFRPADVLVNPRGRVQPTRLAPWYRRFDDFPAGAQLGGLAESNLPWAWRLPGKAVEFGQEWRQIRTVPAPGADERLPLSVLYHLAPLAPDEPGDELLVRYEASDETAGPAHSRRQVTGQLTFAAADGRVTGSEQVVHVTGPGGDQPGLVSAEVRTVVTLTEVKPAPAKG